MKVFGGEDDHYTAMASGFWECQILFMLSSTSMQTLPSDIIKTSTDQRCFNVVVVAVVDVVVVDVDDDVDVEAVMRLLPDLA